MTTRHARNRTISNRNGRGGMAAMALVMAASLGLPGCGSDDAAKGPALTAGDFRAPGTVEPAAPAAKPGAPAGPAGPRSPLAGAATTKPVTPPDSQAPGSMTPETASGGVTDVAVLVGEPEAKGDPNAKPTSELLTIDTMVGQVNGKAVFANQFFQETRLDGVLRANLYTAPTVTAWRNDTRTQITRALQGRLLDELLLAEARALLTPEEKKGLLNFITHLRENLVSASRGSAIAADEDLRASDNTTLDAKAKNERDQIMLRILMARYIEPHVNVSWRDVQKQYERDLAKYTVPGEASLRMIFVTKTKTENVEKVRAALAEGESFDTIAKGPLNEFSPASGGQLPTKKIETTYAETKLIDIDAVNPEAQKLSPGQTAGPIEAGTRLIWVHLDKLVPKQVVPLEDAQLDISGQLYRSRRDQEIQKFFVRISERGNRTDENLMIDRLVAIAQERFLENGQFSKAVQLERAKAPTRPGNRPGTPNAPSGIPPAPRPGGAPTAPGASTTPGTPAPATPTPTPTPPPSQP